MSVQLIVTVSFSVSITQLDTLQMTIEHLKDTYEQGFDFVPINISTLRVNEVSDGSFVHTIGMENQLLNVVQMVDAQGRANLVPIASKRCHSLCRRAMPANVHALSPDFDYDNIFRAQPKGWRDTNWS